MSYSRVPESAVLVERFHGIDTDNNVMVVSAYRYRATGRKDFMYFVVTHREVNRRTEAGSRHVWWLPAPVSRETLGKHLAPLRATHAASIERAHQRMEMWHAPLG